MVGNGQAISRGSRDTVFKNRKFYHDIGYLTKIFDDGKLGNGQKAYVLYVRKSDNLKRALRKTKK